MLETRNNVNFDSFLREAALFGGINWRKYRRRSARRQVKTRMGELGIDTLDDYLVRLGSDAEERANLPDLMRVTVSRFFREKECWQALADTVLPALLGGIEDVAPLRVCIAGCCGGEEPYTMAMIWLETIAPSNPGRTVEIVATDIDHASLERARNGRYDAGSLREVPHQTKTRFFIPEKGAWRIDDRVRELVRFEKRNLMSDPLPCGADLVLCRYLAFTYYEGERLLSAAARLRNALRPAGVLMIGRKELLPEGASTMFEPLQGCNGFYRRI
jgi:chemotaxis methyl-accepting protein methylase